LPANNSLVVVVVRFLRVVGTVFDPKPRFDGRDDLKA
jgi:hypothetical protein